MKMNEIIVKIKWDDPSDGDWLNQYNIKLALEMCCTNTKFEVEEIAKYNMQTLEELKEAIKEQLEILFKKAINKEDFLFLRKHAKIGIVESLSTTMEDYAKMRSIEKKYND